VKTFCDIVIEFENQKMIDTVLKSVSVDDFDFVKSKKTGFQLKAHIESNSLNSLLHTLDDYLACVSVASKIVDKK
jgi:hypothetical protein